MSHRRRTAASLCAIAGTVSLTAVFLPAAAAQDLPAPGSSDVASSIESSLPGSHVPDLTGTDGPKNIIYLVGDGMGYNHIAAANLFETGQTKHQVEGEAGDVSPVEGGEAAQVYEGDEWNELAMSTFQEGNSYDPEKAWNDHDYVNEDYTDSAAAGTAMATCSKTENGMIGVTSDGATVQNTSEHAIDNGKSAGVVSSVPFNHATPAAWAGHNDDRNDFHAMADEMIGGDLDVIMGAGHPLYDADNQPVDEPNYEWISEESFTELSAGETDSSTWRRTPTSRRSPTVTSRPATSPARRTTRPGRRSPARPVRCRSTPGTPITTPISWCRCSSAGRAARTSPLRRPGSTRCAATTSTTSTSPTSP